jgi:hypothetical protein
MNFFRLFQSIGFIFVLSILMATPLDSQIIIRNGSGEPDKRVVADWYLDTLEHNAWYKFDGDWSQLYGFNVRGIVDCNGAILIHTADDTLMYSRSGRVIHPVTAYECHDDITLIYFRSLRMFYADTLFLGMNYGHPTYLKQIIVHGKPAYCVTMYDLQEHGLVSLSEVHGWGILALSGEWLVEPKFDKPFEFTGGFAEVLYYGEKRRINENGEFVE